MAERRDNTVGDVLRQVAIQLATQFALLTGRNTLETSADMTAVQSTNTTNPISDVMLTPQITTQECMICIEDFDEGDLTNYKCLHCTVGRICAPCLAIWFITASKDETRMPPRCCSIIPVSAVSNLITTAEIELYESKFEEWSTVNGLYCPIPTCSAFIPQKLYLSQQPTSGGNNLIVPVSSAVLNTPSLIKVQVICHACHTSICTSCHELTHDGECPESEIDTELNKCLTESNVKRCPKCRAGVHRGIGCSEVQCRCGASFCFHCLQHPTICKGECDVLKGTAAPRVEESRIQAKYKQALAKEMKGGEEDRRAQDKNVQKALKYSACEHEFHHAETHEGSQEDSRLECVVCSQLVRTVEGPKTNPPATQGPGMRKVGYYEVAWECKCGVIVCGNCLDSHSRISARRLALAMNKTQDPNTDLKES